ncbi:hypothetical protein Thexy_0127 [Thermoanaerobacterium xylanolyticum LX-11]|uniref:Uncharacterized protein n=1 Tax=Thermoanaerobacterium xylanolyticum (strain ATCC 49914 / DSM 7097 / LX-11) TaxID=858215 RepID=F6BFB0_THEXL|nr:hypothetical protein [Thermoanaerobacterium xylanolyticum]AEF16188.1 hypothetical protein Thexy_0127 [Thermoanaerobacterium xylanolyticum LX-11]
MNKKLVTKESIFISLAVLLIAVIAIMSLTGLQDKNKNDEIIKIKQTSCFDSITINENYHVRQQ